VLQPGGEKEHGMVWLEVSQKLTFSKSEINIKCLKAVIWFMFAEMKLGKFMFGFVY
jgi:hypothetical protein